MNVSIDLIAATAADTGNKGLRIAEQYNIAGLLNPSSPDAAMVPVGERWNTAILDGTSAVPLGGGAANDTRLGVIHIALNAITAAAVTISGFAKTADGAAFVAANIVLTGSTTEDTEWTFLKGSINSAGPLICTATVDEKVTVQWRPV